MKTFAIEVKRFPAIRTAGMHVHTSMDKASQDCPALWSEKFGPRMESFPVSSEYPNLSFGLSTMESISDFTYWAVLPIAEGAEVPAGMERIEIPGGFYACCDIASLAELGALYNYVYMQWPKEQTKHNLDISKPSVEVYTSEFMKTGGLAVRCPLIEK